MVYKARQANPPRWVALKIMLGGIYATEEARRRFTREVAATASLRHPGVVPIYEAGDHEGLLYYTMELIEGEALHIFLQRHCLSLEDQLRLFRQIAEVVQHAHERGLIHRDLKPSNIMVDQEGRGHVLDFGLAKSLTAPRGVEGANGQTLTGSVLGTYAYMSPEQAYGVTGEVDEQSDVYSLGVILYEMLTQQLPYPTDSGNPADIIQSICTKEPKRPSAIDRNLRGDLETIILTCLEKDKRHRYHSVAELSDDVGRFLRIEPIQARPTPLARRLSKFVRRNRLVVAGATIAIVLAVATGVSMRLIPILLALRDLESPSPATRQQAWTKLSSQASNMGLNRALLLLQNSGESQRKLEALQYLETVGWGTRYERVLRTLSTTIKDPDPEVRSRAWTVLRRQTPDCVAAAALMLLQDAREDELKLEALENIEQIGQGASDDEVLRALAVALKDQGPAVRRETSRLFGKHASSKLFLREIGRPLPVDVRCTLIASLSEKGGPEATDELRHLVVDEDPQISQAAREAFGQRVRKYLLASKELVSWLNDEERGVREVAVEGLYEVSGEDAAAAKLFGSEEAIVKALLFRLDHRGQNGMVLEDGVIRKMAAATLVRLGAEVEWEELRRLLRQEEDPGVAPYLAELVGASGHQEAMDLLCQTLEAIYAEPYPLLWKGFLVELIRQVGARGQTGAIPESARVLLKALETKDTDVRLAAVKAIGELKVDPREAGVWALPLTECLSDAESLAVRLAALASLEQLAAPQSVAKVVAAFKASNDVDDRSAILMSLSRLYLKVLEVDAQAAAEAWAVLLDPEELRQFGMRVNLEDMRLLGELLDDKSEQVRTQAAQWLNELTGGQLDVGPLSKAEVRRRLQQEWLWDDSRRLFVPKPKEP